MPQKLRLTCSFTMECNQILFGVLEIGSKGACFQRKTFNRFFPTDKSRYFQNQGRAEKSASTAALMITLITLGKGRVQIFISTMNCLTLTTFSYCSRTLLAKKNPSCFLEMRLVKVMLWTLDQSSFKVG